MTEYLTIHTAWAWASSWLTMALQHLQAPFALVELFAMACGLLGSLLLALKGDRAALGWLLFAASNAGWLSFAFGHGHWFLFLQQIGFSITSLIGIWTWLWVPWIERRSLLLLNEVTGL